MTTPIFCFRCKEILARYDEWNHEQFYIGQLGHICKDGSLAITRIDKWFKQGKEIVDDVKKKRERDRDSMIMNRDSSPVPYYLE